MTVDKAKLRELANEFEGQEWIYAIHDDCEYVEGPAGFVASPDSHELGKFIAAANPAAILDLLDEIESWRGALAGAQQERDRLKEENKVLVMKARRNDLEVGRHALSIHEGVIEWKRAGSSENAMQKIWDRLIHPDGEGLLDKFYDDFYFQEGLRQVTHEIKACKKFLESKGIDPDS